MLSPTASFADVVSMLTLKFGKAWDHLNFTFSDEYGTEIRLNDSMDWDMAVEVARIFFVLGKGAKLDVWLVE